MINFNNEEFFNKGFYVGKNHDIFDDVDEFHKNIDDMVKITNEKNLFRYRYNISLPPDADISKVPGNMNKLHIDTDLIPAMDEYVKEYNVPVFQKWWETNDISHLNDIISYFRKNVEKLLVNIYPKLENNFKHHDNFTLYKNTDFIQPHKDGMNVGRCCVVLIYLSHEKDYNDGGGEIVITEGDFNEKVVPINENFCILDFTKNNPYHAVNPVKNNFERYTYINFVYERDLYESYMKEKQSKNIL
jgi:Rps23 Pro-64 3,4-dihydroxylase Tpa1-like proline 4-hydroxylase